MIGKENEQTLEKALKITNQKCTHTGPTNSAEKFFSNRIEFTLVAVGNGIVAKSVKS